MTQFWFAQSIKLIVVAFILCASQEAYAELYTYVDKSGIVHFTNIRPRSRKKPKAEKNYQNTYTWEDRSGTSQSLHRVNVSRFDQYIIEAAEYYTLPAALVKAVVSAESGFEPFAVSPVGAQGLMQLMPGTAKDMYVDNSFDPKQNIYGGARYLRFLANRFNGDLPFMVAAYNAGPEAVARAGGIPPFAETQNYVKRVMTLYKHYLTQWKAS